MKLIQALAATAIAFALVGTSRAQEVFYPGNGVSLPVVVTEVHPSAAAAATVALQCIVRPNGTASDIEVAFSPDARLSQAATDALSKWQFTPGLKDGKPVAVRIFVEVSFVAPR
jgi:TonB family protein